MNYLTALQFIVFACLAVCLQGCEPKNWKINGKMFVETKDGKVVALDSFKVSVVTEAAVNEYLQNRKNVIEALASPAETAAIAAYHQFKESHPADPNPVTTIKGFLSESSQQRSQIEEQFSTVNFFFTNAPPASLVTTTTDASGKFSFTIPTNGRFAIFAKASRQTRFGTEKFVWFVWISTNYPELNQSNSIDVYNIGSVIPFTAISNKE